MHAGRHPLTALTSPFDPALQPNLSRRRTAAPVGVPRHPPATALPPTPLPRPTHVRAFGLAFRRSTPCLQSPRTPRVATHTHRSLAARSPIPAVGRPWGA